METGSEDEFTSGEEKRSLPVQQKRQDWDLNEMQIEGMSHPIRDNSVRQGFPGLGLGDPLRCMAKGPSRTQWHSDQTVCRLFSLKMSENFNRNVRL